MRQPTVHICRTDELLRIVEHIHFKSADHSSVDSEKISPFEYNMRDFILSKSDIHLDYSDLMEFTSDCSWVTFAFGHASGRNAATAAISEALQKLFAEEEIADKLIVYVLMSQSFPIVDLVNAFEFVRDRLTMNDSALFQISHDHTLKADTLRVLILRSFPNIPIGNDQ